ncbi:hypothetical protein [Sphingomonas oligophenolica]|uniref:Uncharacterized protein n=1 Tax=Sphingomonas oligophenolica TaxID=301154 RepID=A0A502CHN6_9SPHN|nr:hypothetical protein [Sphingomonas oligophenolica]TPG13165.1 hypothetical protein EAH84_07130 [Sphingomonas oligophenolica]
MNREQEAAIVQAFIDELGAGPHTGTEAFRAFLGLEAISGQLFEGLGGDPWQQVHALLNRRGVTSG